VRAVVIMAVVAALSGAPSSVSAAASHLGPLGGARLTLAELSEASDRETASADDLVSTLLLVGLAGVASVAIVGTLLLFAGRRRQPERAETIPPPNLAHRRPMSPADDPIVAALGVDDEMAARRAIRRARSSGVSDDTRTNRPRRR
jgi:hypothetical protein